MWPILQNLRTCDVFPLLCEHNLWESFYTEIVYSVQTFFYKLFNTVPENKLMASFCAKRKRKEWQGHTACCALKSTVETQRHSAGGDLVAFAGQ